MPSSRSWASRSSRWIAQIAIAVVLLRQPFANRAVGAALRFGLVLTILGAGIGFLMVIPSGAVLEAAWQGGKLLVVGSHTIGGSDGGAGLPLVNWSREHGDLRAAHFLGLHALQLLPLFAWAPARVGVAAVQHARLVVVGGSSYLALLVILVVQGCRESRCSRPAG